ncbi:MAG: transcription antitermination factor NusB [Gemmatimonadales bacterium]
MRPETKTRARALQLLYAWELQGRPPMDRVVVHLLTGNPVWRRSVEGGEPLAGAVAEQAARLDAEIEAVADNWRLDRIGVIEHNILRLAVYELLDTTVPPRVAISEAVQLAHWFAGSKAPGFVNGVLDAVARGAGRL